MSFSERRSKDLSDFLTDTGRGEIKLAMQLTEVCPPLAMHCLEKALRLFEVAQYGTDEEKDLLAHDPAGWYYHCSPSE